MDFSGLAGITGFSQFQDGTNGPSNFSLKLRELAGTGFYSTCNGCNEQYSILFEDDQGSYEFTSAQSSASGRKLGAVIHVNLTLIP